jgi:SAM-dependent methyltransferase
VSGQPGKDVVWVPTPPELVDLMMQLAKVTPNDLVMDLGSGDGRNIIAAAKLGAHAIGVEYNPEMVELSRRLAKDAGVSEKAEFVQADMYTYDVSKANVLALFLLPVNLNRLAPKFFNLAPGSRVVSNTFGIDGWQPDQRATLPSGADCDTWCEALLWIVPAKVAGMWSTAEGAMTLTQEFQEVKGSITIAGRPWPLTGKLLGNEFTFKAGDFSYKAIVNGNTIEGTVTTPSGPVPWKAQR